MPCPLNLASTKVPNEQGITWLHALLCLLRGGNGTNSEISINKMRSCAVSTSKIEKMKCTIKTHRAAVDFDKSFCKAKVVVKKEKVD